LGDWAGEGLEDLTSCFEDERERGSDEVVAMAMGRKKSWSATRVMRCGNMRVD